MRDRLIVFRDSLLHNGEEKASCVMTFRLKGKTEVVKIEVVTAEVEGKLDTAAVEA